MGSTPSTDMKYTKEILEEAAKESYSVREVMRRVGAPLRSSSLATHLSRQLKKFEIDTTHFTGQGSNKGKTAPNKKHYSEYLVLRNSDQAKLTGRVLRRAMIEYGIKYQCSCGLIDIWLNKELNLEIDHINGNCLDNRPENLRFLCPNCHSQTETHSRKKG